MQTLQLYIQKTATKKNTKPKKTQKIYKQKNKEISILHSNLSETEKQTKQLIPTTTSTIKSDLHLFPVELHCKILQYVRDCEQLNLPIHSEQIAIQIRNELISIEQSRLNIESLIETMQKLEKSEANSIHDHNPHSKHNLELELRLQEFIQATDKYLQQQADTTLTSHSDPTNRKRVEISEKILAILDTRRCAEIGVRCIIDLLNHSIKKDQEQAQDMYFFDEMDEVEDDDMADDTETSDKLARMIPIAVICSKIGREIERDWQLQQLIVSKDMNKFLVQQLNKYNLNISNSFLNPKTRFDLAVKLGIKIGTFMDDVTIFRIGSLVCKAVIESSELNQQKAFRHDIIWNNKQRRGVIKCNPHMNLFLSTRQRFKPPQEIHPVSQPMIIPPRPWKNIQEGPFFMYNVDLMRYDDKQHQFYPLQTTHYRDSNSEPKQIDISDFLECLNVLQSTAWVINRPVLDILQYIYNHENGNVAKLPNKVDTPMPEPPVLAGCNKEESEEMLQQYRYQCKQVKKQNAEQHSLRCDFELRSSLARDLCSQPAIYFPLNVDFRGRVYPIPPHVNHIGSDLVRGLMKFAKKKQLGVRGWYWLRVNIANRFGYDKVPNDKRLEWTDSNLENILACAQDPLNHRWWLTADSPWQALSICFEISDAINTTNNKPELFYSNLPVGQDGSCNGLQHYAAMLRDVQMAEYVNVAARDSKGDVYSAVAQCVSKMVEHDAEHHADPIIRGFAQKVNGKITRKILKQTVMTSVYGVTAYGARNQIRKWLSEAMDLGAIEPFPNTPEGKAQLRNLSMYLGGYTMDAIGQTNTAAFLAMTWLKDCAKKIATSGHRVSWITPLGLSCTQHYANRSVKIRTALQMMSIRDEKGVVTPGKQSTAFPPNFIHSLDSTHCLMTARACFKSHGLTFASIHDSFWTHASDVDIMNTVLREEFIKLHDRPLLQELYQSFQVLYPQIDFAPPPKSSTFDLQEVKKSEFFFS